MIQPMSQGSLVRFLLKLNVRNFCNLEPAPRGTFVANIFLNIPAREVYAMGFLIPEASGELGCV